MSTLVNLQVLFPKLVAILIQKIAVSGYGCTFGEAYRTPEQAALNAKAGIGITNSTHTMRLGIDLNLFKDGIYLTDASFYDQFGAFWVSLHPLARYGGNFKIRDGNHFSLTYQGIS